ncbi:hypothetical protein [Gordonia sp. HS-NH1]|uniref:hypothetical protein n=1 Tax=Gordonia sp. HS-NH1 TaxID=1435068 RepID=UPI0006E2FE32|nr:hypothetical protein [Gordonia sp. HS-NH1]
MTHRQGGVQETGESLAGPVQSGVAARERIRIEQPLLHRDRRGRGVVGEAQVERAPRCATVVGQQHLSPHRHPLVVGRERGRRGPFGEHGFAERARRRRCGCPPRAVCTVERGDLGQCEHRRISVAVRVIRGHEEGETAVVDGRRPPGPRNQFRASLFRRLTPDPGAEIGPGHDDGFGVGDLDHVLLGRRHPPLGTVRSGAVVRAQFFVPTHEVGERRGHRTLVEDGVETHGGEQESRVHLAATPLVAHRRQVVGLQERDPAPPLLRGTAHSIGFAQFPFDGPTADQVVAQRDHHRARRTEPGRGEDGPHGAGHQLPSAAVDPPVCAPAGTDSTAR